MRKNVIITGVNGFLGRSLRQYLETVPGYNIFGIDRVSRNTFANLYVCDLTDDRAVLRILRKVQPHYIFHFAGGKVQDQQQLLSANFFTTKTILEALGKLRSQQTRLIIPGTAAEYGKINYWKNPVCETFSTQPITWYGLVKDMQTRLGLMYAKAGFNVVIARMFNICGYGTPPTLAIGSFSRAISLVEKGLNERVIHTKNLEGKRDFLDIHDVCSLLLCVAKYGKRGEIYNVCSSKSYNIKQLLNKLLEYSNVSNISISEDKESFSESFNCIGSNQKVRRLASWKPAVPMDRSLLNTLNYYRSLQPA